MLSLAALDVVAVRLMWLAVAFAAAAVLAAVDVWRS